MRKTRSGVSPGNCGVTFSPSTRSSSVAMSAGSRSWTAKYTAPLTALLAAGLVMSTRAPAEGGGLGVGGSGGVGAPQAAMVSRSTARRGARDDRGRRTAGMRPRVMRFYLRTRPCRLCPPGHGYGQPQLMLRSLDANAWYKLAPALREAFALGRGGVRFRPRSVRQQPCRYQLQAPRALRCLWRGSLERLGLPVDVEQERDQVVEVGAGYDPDVLRVRQHLVEVGGGAVVQVGSRGVQPEEGGRLEPVGAQARLVVRVGAHVDEDGLHLLSARASHGAGLAWQGVARPTGSPMAGGAACRGEDLAAADGVARGLGSSRDPEAVGDERRQRVERFGPPAVGRAQQGVGRALREALAAHQVHDVE